MLIKRPRGWEMPERLATPEAVYHDRRRFLAGLPAVALAASLPGAALLPATARAAAPDPTADLYPAKRNEKYVLDRPVTAEKHATTYNNFYEFGTSKDIWKEAQERLKIRPWTVAIDGMVEKPFSIGFDELIRKMPVEERLYRHRCVEAWSMAVPWSGFPMAALVALAKPLGSAKYIEMKTFMDPKMAPAQKQSWYPWPYTEGLTVAEANNELAFIATGLYGKPIPHQNGAPLRLAVPWKYGFKSVKSIVSFTFTEKRPKSYWEVAQGAEYGFWANVNPAVSHPRWSQAKERVLGTSEQVPTQIWNGYGEFVAGLYAEMKGEKLFM